MQPGESPDTRVLLIEDDAADVLLVERRLDLIDSAGHCISLESAPSLGEGFTTLDRTGFDVVLLDLHLPDSQGIDTLVRLREHDALVPIVVLTAAGDEEIALRALRAGAQDYVVKDELASGFGLTRAIRYAIERRSIEDENRELQDRLHDRDKAASLRVLATGAAMGIDDLQQGILEAGDQAVLDLTSHEHLEQVRGDLASLRRHARRAAALAGQLRDYVGEEKPRGARLDLSAFVVELSDLFEREAPRNVEFQYDLPGNLPKVSGDSAQLRQVLVDLVRNAGEAIGTAPGTVQVATGSIWADRQLLVRIHADPDLPEGAYAFVRVTDTGEPLPAEIRARIFEPFFTTKRPGRGLGLAAALGIVRRHRGAIQVEEVAGGSSGGSAFTVLLPCVARLAKASPPERPARQA